MTIFAELVMNKVSANLGRLRRHPRPQLVQGPRPEEDGGKGNHAAVQAAGPIGKLPIDW